MDVKQFMPQGQTKLLNFVADAEPWCQYTLDDGSTVRVRVMLVKAEQLGYHESGEMQGLPNIQLRFQQVMDWSPTDEQKKEASKRRAGGGQ